MSSGKVPKKFREVRRWMLGLKPGRLTFAQREEMIQRWAPIVDELLREIYLSSPEDASDRVHVIAVDDKGLCGAPVGARVHARLLETIDLRGSTQAAWQRLRQAIRDNTVASNPLGANCRVLARKIGVEGGERVGSLSEALLSLAMLVLSTEDQALIAVVTRVEGGVLTTGNQEAVRADLKRRGIALSVAALRRRYYRALTRMEAFVASSEHMNKRSRDAAWKSLELFHAQWARRTGGSPGHRDE